VLVGNLSVKGILLCPKRLVLDKEAALPALKESNESPESGRGMILGALMKRILGYMSIAHDRLK
jgi:hypothetical protein